MSHVVALNQIGGDMIAKSILTSQITLGNSVGDEWEIESLEGKSPQPVLHWIGIGTWTVGTSRRADSREPLGRWEFT